MLISILQPETKPKLSIVKIKIYTATTSIMLNTLFPFNLNPKNIHKINATSYPKASRTEKNETTLLFTHIPTNIY